VVFGWQGLTAAMLHLFVAWIHLTAAWVRLNALIWCYLLTSRALCDPEVLELAENRTIARRASTDFEAHVAEHGSLWRMLYTLFGWLDIEDWQMMLGWGIYYGIPCDVQLVEEDITITEDITSVGDDEAEDHESVMIDSDEGNTSI
jgi:hypothetical protein